MIEKIGVEFQGIGNEFAVTRFRSLIEWRVLSYNFQFPISIIPQQRESLPLTVRAIFQTFTREPVKKRRARCALFFDRDDEGAEVRLDPKLDKILSRP